MTIVERVRLNSERERNTGVRPVAEWQGLQHTFVFVFVRAVECMICIN